MWSIIRNATEAAAVTLLGAVAGYWLAVIAPSRVPGPEAYRAAVLERAVWGAVVATILYGVFRFWGLVRSVPPNDL